MKEKKAGNLGKSGNYRVKKVWADERRSCASFHDVFALYARYTLACTEMTKNKKIEILRAAHVVELSWASIVIIFSFLSLDLGGRALPWTSHRSIEKQKFQISQIIILTADLKSSWKTVCWKCFSFFKIPSGSLPKSMLNIF